MRRLAGLIAVVAAGALAAPSTVSADQLVAKASGARNLAAGGGWMAWAQRSGSRWKLVTRSPGGQVADAMIATFGAPPDPAIGSSGYGIAGKRVIAVYSRCDGTSSRLGCDVYRYDLKAGTEQRVTSISTAAASEIAPSVALGQYGFVRVGGPSPGTYTAARHIHRVDTRLALETAVSGSRIVYTVAIGATRQVILSQYDGGNRRVLTTGLGIFSPVTTRYRAGWLQHRGGSVIARMTDRINPSTTTPTIRDGSRPLPVSTNSATADASRIALYLDAKGVHRASPPLFHP